MLKHISLIAGLFALGMVVLPANDDAKEPALGIKLTLGDHQSEVKLGEEFEVELGDITYKGKLEAAATRTFDKRGLSFEYPSGFTYDYEPDPDVTMFTLEGPDTLIMLQVFSLEMDAEELCELVMGGMAEEFEELDLVHSEAEIELDGEKLHGHRLQISIVGTTMVQEGFGIALDGETAVLFTQGSLDEEGNLVKESEDAIELLTRTFSFK